MTALILPLSAIRKVSCSDQFRLVEAEWPGGVPVSINTVRRAMEMGLSLDFFASRFLTSPARAEYEKVTGQAWAEYEKVTGQALVRAVRRQLKGGAQ